MSLWHRELIVDLMCLDRKNINTDLTRMIIGFVAVGFNDLMRHLEVVFEKESVLLDVSYKARVDKLEKLLFPGGLADKRKWPQGCSNAFGGLWGFCRGFVDVQKHLFVWSTAKGLLFVCDTSWGEDVDTMLKFIRKSLAKNIAVRWRIADYYFRGGASDPRGPEVLHSFYSKMMDIAEKQEGGRSVGMRAYRGKGTLVWVSVNLNPDWTPEQQALVDYVQSLDFGAKFGCEDGTPRVKVTTIEPLGGGDLAFYGVRLMLKDPFCYFCEKKHAAHVDVKEQFYFPPAAEFAIKHPAIKFVPEGNRRCMKCTTTAHFRLPSAHFEAIGFITKGVKRRKSSSRTS